MTLVNTLGSYGITIGMVQMTVVGAIVVYIIGTYWKVLLTGIGIIAIAAILLYSESSGNKPTSPVVEPTVITPISPTVVEPVPIQSVPTPTPMSKVTPTVPDAFMEDCMKEAEYTKEECEKIWTNP
jgi:hypothetical protein